MEDLKAYIESGVLELYVLGDLSSDERHEVELMVGKHPELQHELLVIEKSMQRYAENYAVEPKADLRNKVLDALDYRDEVPVKSLHADNESVGSGNFYKYAFAASIALLMVSVAALISLNNQLKESHQRIASLENSNQKFSNRVNYINKQLSNTQQTLEVYKNSKDYQLVELVGLPKAPEAKMVVAFNAAKEEVMIDLASLEMPQNDDQHQYQLWALVDGKPVDLGVFDKKADSTGMIKMKPIKNAQAFAVTLEPKGGSASPTLNQMMVMGNI
ncbi:MAG TPA: anti-sigma factor [Sphingobacteriaceae bacterium]